MFKIETKDLILRDIQKSDLQKHLYWLTQETEWWNWDAACWYLLELSEEQRKIEIEKLMHGLEGFLEMISNKSADDTRYSFQIEEKVSGEYIGYISCYCIDSNFEATDEEDLYAFGIDIPETKFRGKGYGEQAFSAAIKYYKSKGIDEVYTQTWSGNMPMIRLAEKLGFELISVRKNHREHNGKKYDALTFRI